MNKSSELSNYERKLAIQPIKLKSINQERAFTRSFKLSSSFSLPLTEQRFERQMTELEQLRYPRKDLKFNTNSLKSEIAIATSKALQSVHSYTQSKESIHFRSSRRLGLKFLNSTGNSPTTERVNLSGFTDPNTSFKFDTPKANRGNNELRSSVRGSRDPFPVFMKENGFDCEGKIKETVFIDKLKAATIKLRELRLGLNRFK